MANAREGHESTRFRNALFVLCKSSRSSLGPDRGRQRIRCL